MSYDNIQQDIVDFIISLFSKKGLYLIILIVLIFGSYRLVGSLTTKPITREILSKEPYFGHDLEYWDGFYGFYDGKDNEYPEREGILFMHPFSIEENNHITQSVYLDDGYNYTLRAGIANIGGLELPGREGTGCGHTCSDSIAKIKVVDSSNKEHTLYSNVLTRNEGWIDISFDITKYAGQRINITLEAHAGGPCSDWCGEWTGVDYFFVESVK